MGSSQETYVTIEYRLENNSFEPKLNDIGTRHTLSILDNILNLG